MPNAPFASRLGHPSSPALRVNLSPWSATRAPRNVHRPYSRSPGRLRCARRGYDQLDPAPARACSGPIDVTPHRWALSRSRAVLGRRLRTLQAACKPSRRSITARRMAQHRPVRFAQRPHMRAVIASCVRLKCVWTCHPHRQRRHTSSGENRAAVRMDVAPSVPF